MKNGFLLDCFKYLVSSRILVIAVSMTFQGRDVKTGVGAYRGRLWKHPTTDRRSIELLQRVSDSRRIVYGLRKQPWDAHASWKFRRRSKPQLSTTVGRHAQIQDTCLHDTHNAGLQITAQNSVTYTMPSRLRVGQEDLV